MHKTRPGIVGRAATVSYAAMIAALVAMPAFAQDAPEADSEVETLDIVVTGSLITNPNLSRATPVLAVTRAELDLRQSSDAEELLRELPGIVPNQGSAVNNSQRGASFVDLRGLGPNRTLALIDGKRITPSGLEGQFDLNNIPLALIDRVDVATGGAVTTYGADAIAGAVNFITRRNFEGVEITAATEIAERGDGKTDRLDITVGGNFADGRGNMVLSLGYQNREAVTFVDRDVAPQIDYQTNSFTGSSFTTPSVFSFDGGGRDMADPLRLSGRRQYVAALGAVNPQSGTAVPEPFNYQPGNLFQAPFRRFSAYAQGNYDITDNIEVYSRLLFSKNKVTAILGPQSASTTLTVPVSNPFLSNALRTQFCNNQDFDLATAGIQTLSTAQCDAAALATSPSDPNYRTFNTGLRRRTVEVGNRIRSLETTIFDFRGGFRGNITDAIKWDVAGAYGESDRPETISNFPIISRVQNSVLATNTTTCLPGLNGSPPAGCVPANFFGPAGSLTPAMVAYLSVPSIVTVSSKLAQASGTISGDLGIASPGAETPIAFAVGTEYRKYTAGVNADIISQTQGEIGGAIANFNGGYDVVEGLAEVIVPVLEDRPGFYRLTVEAGARYSKYSIDAAGNPNYDAFTYKGAVSWEPIESLKFRASYSRAVRAPNIGELFSPVSTGSLVSRGDLCVTGGVPITNANLRAVCIAQGATAAQADAGSIAAGPSATVNVVRGGNPNLGPEKANTFTVGAIIQPASLPGFNVSLDYYKITVTDAITSPTVGDSLASCFNNVTAASATSAACTRLRRAPLDEGSLGFSAVGVPLVTTNFGRLENSGIDLGINFRADLGKIRLGGSFAGTYALQRKFQANPASINRDCVGFFSVDCESIQPELQWSQRTTVGFGNYDVSLLWRYIGAVELEPRVAATQPAAAGLGNIAAYNYFDLAFQAKVMDKMTISFLIRNLLDKGPPITGDDVGNAAFNSGNTYPSTYDAIGRSYGLSVRLTL